MDVSHQAMSLVHSGTRNISGREHHFAVRQGGEDVLEGGNNPFQEGNDSLLRVENVVMSNFVGLIYREMSLYFQLPQQSITDGISAEWLRW